MCTQYTGTRNIGCITLAISDTTNTATVTGNMLVVWVHTLGTACLDIETQANTEQADITTHSVPECGFEGLKTYQAPAHIGDLPR